MAERPSPLRRRTVAMSGRLEGLSAIVTGASSGIGRAIALRFAAEGAAVVIADVRETPREGGESTLDAIRNLGRRAEYLKADVSRGSEVTALVAGTVERHGRLDIIVNNAAVSSGQRLTETEESDWDHVVDVNLKGVYLCCREAVRQMLRQAPRGEHGNECRGRIVNISSQHGMISAPNDFAYGVTKSGVVYMTRQIAADYAKDGIVCNAVAPGKILTGKGGVAVSAQALAYSESRTPMPRLGRPEDVASAVTFLASDEATYITGINLMVDGGWMAA